MKNTKSTNSTKSNTLTAKKHKISISLITIILLTLITLTGCSNNTTTRLDKHATLINDLEYTITRLESRIKDLERASGKTEYNFDDWDNTESTTETYTPSPVYLSNGSYKVGVDITAGTYDLIAISGYGQIKGDFASGFIATSIGIDDKRNNETYKNLKLTTGDTFEIRSGVEIKFVPK